MAPAGQVVITGVGVLSPIGIGKEAFWSSLRERTSGVRILDVYADTDLPYRLGAELLEFDPKQYVKPRKSLKVMCREIQTGYAAASMAMADAKLEQGDVAPERLGVVYGCEMLYGLTELETAYRHCIAGGQFDFRLWGENAMRDIEPLWMLKYLPNMVACHIGIAQDARGPNNTHLMRETSFLAALLEGANIIERGAADVMIAGASGSGLSMMSMLTHGAGSLSQRFDEPSRAVRPFDAARDGSVNGEGAAALILESRKHAEARGAEILGRMLGGAIRFGAPQHGPDSARAAIRNSITAALQSAGLGPQDVGHVNANAAGDVSADACEAQAIADVLQNTPVTALKSFFGNLRAAAGAVETAASLLAFSAGEVPATLNYETPDPACPVNVICDGPAPLGREVAVLLNQTYSGQAAAAVISGP